VTERAPISAGSADKDADPTDLLPRLDIWAFGKATRDVAAYGPNAGVVEAVIRRAATFDTLDVERAGSIIGHGNDDTDASLRDIRAVAGAIRAAALVTRRESSVRAAFLDGQRAVFLACNPVMGALEHWWTNYPEVSAMDAAGFLAAAEVVADTIEPDALALARRPFVALDEGLPAGLFGPRHDDVAAIIDAAAWLTEAQVGRIVRAWARPPTGDLRSFGYSGPRYRERGIDGWMPPDKGRRHHAWIRLRTEVDPQVGRDRRLAWATLSAKIRAGHSPGANAHWLNGPKGDAGILLTGAVEAAVAASLLADRVPADLVAELTEAWRSLDGDLEPSTW
jgi:hypothetical protein